tara:strand:+ start:6030 stop:7553 length:1524 start_codon:yes stop_codon:yes gene_type:complete
MELVSAGQILPDEELALTRADRMHALYERWQETPSLDNALELLDCSSFISDNGLFFGPAAQIINSSDATRTSKFVAQQVVRPDRKLLNPTYDFSNRQDLHKIISVNRRRLQTETQNSLLHSEQARLYAIIDEPDAAERSFNIALAISPDNRHILRGFSRFMVHIGGPEKALQRLRRSNAMASDPWLQAAEIAISEQHGVGSHVARAATKNLEASHVMPEHISELATALATLERSVGNRKKFKKRLIQSLQQPSDNALAQASWYIRQAPDDVDEEVSDAILPLFHNSKEARTYTLLKGRRWREAVQCFADWQREESFSSHIAIEGSFYAVSFAKDYEAAASICRNGLVANSTSHGLLNNLCYAERRMGRVEDAVKTMEKLKSVHTAWKTFPVYLATDGMLKFALGDYEAGRIRYQEALKIADDGETPLLRQRIKMHWLHEEVISGTVTEVQSKHLISKLDSDSGIGTGVKEFDDYWDNIKEEIMLESSNPVKMHVQSTNIVHSLDKCI